MEIVGTESKRCNRCDEVKRIEEFGPRKRNGKIVPCPYCRSCHNARVRDQFAAIREINKTRPPDMTGTKVCSRCGIEKSVTKFYLDRNRIGGRRHYYRVCSSLHSKERGKATPETYKAIRRRSNLKREFGMTPDDYEKMLAEQGGGCAICGRLPQPTDKRNMPVDHCHVTGQVRGILCSECNFGVGKFKDNPDLMRRAIDYLSRSKRSVDGAA